MNEVKTKGSIPDENNLVSLTCRLSIFYSGTNSVLTELLTAFFDTD
jgi:hypothetical protein